MCEKSIKTIIVNRKKHLCGSVAQPSQFTGRAIRDAAGDIEGGAPGSNRSVRADATAKKESRQFESADCADLRRCVITLRRKYVIKSVHASRTGMKKNSNEHKELETNSRHRNSFKFVPVCCFFHIHLVE